MAWSMRPMVLICSLAAVLAIFRSMVCASRQQLVSLVRPNGSALLAVTVHFIFLGAGTFLFAGSGRGQQTLGRVEQFERETRNSLPRPFTLAAHGNTSDPELVAQRRMMAALANSLVLHAVSLEDQLLLVVVNPTRVRKWVDVLEDAGRNVSRVLPLACVYSPGTPREELVPLRFFSAVDRRCFIRCALPGEQHGVGSRATLGIIPQSGDDSGSAPGTTPGSQAMLGAVPLFLLLRSEATLGPHNATLAVGGYVNMTNPVFGYEYLGQRMVMEVSAQDLESKENVVVFSKGLDVDQLKSKKEQVLCIYGPPLWYRNNTGFTQGTWGTNLADLARLSGVVWVANATSDYFDLSSQLTCPRPPSHMIHRWQVVDVSHVTLGKLPATFSASKGSTEGFESERAAWEALVPVTLADTRGVLPTSAFFDPALPSLEDWLPQGADVCDSTGCKEQGGERAPEGNVRGRRLLEEAAKVQDLNRQQDQGREGGLGTSWHRNARVLQESVPSSKSGKREDEGTGVRMEKKPPVKGHLFFLCSCTIMWDHVESLREWAIFHAWMGVEQLHIYDNNSDDGVSVLARSLSKVLRRARSKGNPPRQKFGGWEGKGEVGWHQRWEEERGSKDEVGEMESSERGTRGVRVALRNWPWLKMQGPAMAHSLLTVGPICKWALVADVDEFLLPKFLFPYIKQGLPGLDAIRYTTGPFLPYWIKSKVGRYPKAGTLRVPWCMFRPSGHKCRPGKGMTPSYTCRDKDIHKMSKSVVLIEALAVPGRMEYIHRFELKRPYLDSFDHKALAAIIYHYKFQAWEEFKKRYYRVASNFPDFKDAFGFPKNWPNETPGYSNSSCAVVDSSMANFVKLVFLNMKDSSQFPWEVETQRCSS